MAWTIPWNLLGIVISGDIGDVTIYRNKNGKVVPFPKDMHQEATSPLRAWSRNRFRVAQANWAALTDDQKADLEAACRSLSLPLTGQNLYISVQLRNRQSHYKTIERQSGITLPAFTHVPGEPV